MVPEANIGLKVPAEILKALRFAFEEAAAVAVEKILEFAPWPVTDVLSALTL